MHYLHPNYLPGIVFSVLFFCLKILVLTRYIVFMTLK